MGEAEEFPRELYLKAGAARILGIGYPEAYGGSCEGDLFARWRPARAHALRFRRLGRRVGIAGYRLAPVVKWARPEVRERVVPAVLRGEKIMALAVSEPSGGSDVANPEDPCGARWRSLSRQRQQTFITSGVRADYYTVAVRTGGEGFSPASACCWWRRALPEFSVDAS